MKLLKVVAFSILSGAVASSCSTLAAPSSMSVPQPTEPGNEVTKEMTETGFDKNYVKQEGIDVIYLAGGCFWGLEKLMQSIPGVVNAVSGYANGLAGEEPTYPSVSGGQTGYRETVRVEYDPEKVSLDALLFAYFHVINPTIKNAQGNDRGSQYQTGIYYTDEAAKETVERIAAIERSRHKPFVVEIEPLERFYDAEEYHQDYLDKNPMGYCHISREEMATISEMIVDPADHPRPTEAVIKAKLTEEQYRVTQEAGTEPAFQNEYWDNHERGIYVDVVTDEPLFSSKDKFDSGTGWPSFSDAIDENTMILIVDTSHGMRRTEARSRAGNSHLGHVFYGEPSSPTGTRYCMNSASLRFVPFEDMEAEGYGYLKQYVS